jgi:hypothetical protein
VTESGIVVSTPWTFVDVGTHVRPHAVPPVPSSKYVGPVEVKKTFSPPAVVPR